MIGSLFAGIGGLELGLEAAGLGPVKWQVEIDPFARSILARHWPDATRHDDVRTVGAHNLAPVDVICGGFPCQDISTAGKGAGIDGARSGLWAEYARIIGELRPRLVVVENVAALAGRGLGRVLGDLSERGYDAAWFPLRASDVGAPHRRERLFIVGRRVADAVREPARRRRGSGGVGSAAGDAGGEGDQRQRSGDAARDRGQAVGDTDESRLEGQRRERELASAGGQIEATRTGSQPPLSRLGRDADGLPARPHDRPAQDRARAAGCDLRRDLCLACHAPARLTFPEDAETDPPTVIE